MAIIVAEEKNPKKWFKMVSPQGQPQLEKSLKFQLLTKIFQTTSPLFEKGPYQQKCQYFVPNCNHKVDFLFKFSTPPSPISSESQTSTILSIEVAPYRSQFQRPLMVGLIKWQIRKSSNSYYFKIVNLHSFLFLYLICL